MKKITVAELGQFDKKAQSFLLETDLEKIPVGQINLGQGYYVNVDSYQTQQFGSRKYESHRKYIDIQYIVSGQENVFVAPIEKLKLYKNYNASKDIVFYSNEFQGEKICLHRGEIVIFYPKDGHMPCIAETYPQQVKKIVIKIPIKQVNDDKH